MRFRLALGVLIACAPLACILDWNSLQANQGLFDGGVDGGAGDDNFVPVDAGKDTTQPPPEAGPDTSCNAGLLVNELQSEGPFGPSDEFVEIYNAGDCTVSLNAWTIQYSSATASGANAVWTGQPADQIPAKGYVVVGGQQFQGTVIGRFGNGLNGVLSKTGGGVGLFAPGASAPVDSMAYGTITAPTHPFDKPPAGPPAPAPGSGQSAARIPNGVNTNASAADFKITTSTPNKANQ